MNKEEKYLNIIKVNIDDYLADFILTTLGSQTEPVRIFRKNFIGDLLYRLLDKLPENCSFHEPIIPNKRQLKIEIGWLGGHEELRKNPYSYIYLPLSRQREFESAIRSLFDNIFFSVIEITKEYTDQQYKDLIDSFCERYHIDFVKHFDSLKKKHYRARLEMTEMNQK